MYDRWNMMLNNREVRRSAGVVTGHVYGGFHSIVLMTARVPNKDSVRKPRHEFF